jgi:primosomal replication protein N
LNELILVGVVSSLDDIRYTPANIPIRNLTIHFEDSSKKHFFKFVEFEINAVVIGDLVKEDFRINETYQFKGFLDRKSKKSNQLLFHIQEYKLRSK